MNRSPYMTNKPIRMRLQRRPRLPVHRPDEIKCSKKIPTAYSYKPNSSPRRMILRQPKYRKMFFLKWEQHTSRSTAFLGTCNKWANVRCGFFAQKYSPNTRGGYSQQLRTTRNIRRKEKSGERRCPKLGRSIVANTEFAVLRISQ